jgi:branched-chain amino acid aminotransferase
MPGYLVRDGKIMDENADVLHPDNRAFRYGDGLFETIRVSGDRIPLWDLHMNRLFIGLQQLKFPLPKFLTREILLDGIRKLLRKNRLTRARIRITVYRGNGGLTDHDPVTPGYIMQSWPLPEATTDLNSNGLRIGFFRDAIKPADSLSCLKSNNYLAYVMASIYAREQKWNDALLLNQHQHIADSTIANVFWTKNGEVFTNPISDGAVAGVMRQYLIDQHQVTIQSITPEHLLLADEVFLTNAVRGIRWVSFLENQPLQPPVQSLKLFETLIRPLFS